MPLVQISAPTAEPLSTLEAKLHARVSTAAEDSLVAAFVAGVRAHAENKTQRQIVAAKWKLTLDSFPGCGLPQHAIIIPMGAVLQVDSIQYTDMAGVVQTMVAGTDYVVDLGEPVRITPPFGKEWPIPLPQIGAISVAFRAGMVAPLTPDPATDTISVPGWKTLAVNDAVRMSFRDKAAAGDGKLPAPLKALTDYYVQAVVAPDVYKLSAAPGGLAIDLSDAGGGDMFIGELPQGLLAWLRLGVSTMYENRPAVIVDERVSVATLPAEFLDGLLDPYRLVLY